MVQRAAADGGLPEDPDLAPGVDVVERTRRAPGESAAVRPFSPVLIAVVALGGAAGSLARDGLTRAVGAPASGFPWATFAINISGAFLLAALVAAVAARPGTPAWVRPLFGTGLLGGYTTFSTFAVETDRLVSLGRPGLAVGYGAATLLAGALASAAGLVVLRGRE